MEPTNNGAERALRQAVIQRKISHGVQSRAGSLCRTRLLTVCASLWQQVRDVLSFLEKAWIAHRHGGECPLCCPATEQRSDTQEAAAERISRLAG